MYLKPHLHRLLVVVQMKIRLLWNKVMNMRKQHEVILSTFCLLLQISYMSQHQDLWSPNPQQFKIGLEETGLAATIMNPAPSTSIINLNPKKIYRETPFTTSKRKTILPVHFSSIRRSPRLREKHAFRLDTLNRRNAIQTLVPIHSTPEKARHNLDFVIVSNPPSSATFQHQLSNPYESFTEMNTGIQIQSKSNIKTAEIGTAQKKFKFLSESSIF